jgi:cytochrome c556
MKKILVLISALCVTASGLLFVASAQNDMTPEERAAMAVDQRKALFKTLRFNLIPIAGMAQGAPFDAEVAERNARRIAAISSMIPEVLAQDTRSFDVETTALDSIWDNMDDFADKAEDLEMNANAFAEAASSGDFATAMGAFRAFGGSCGNCHDTYRVDTD